MQAAVDALWARDAPSESRLAAIATAGLGATHWRLIETHYPALAVHVALRVRAFKAAVRQRILAHPGPFDDTPALAAAIGCSPDAVRVAAARFADVRRHMRATVAQCRRAPPDGDLAARLRLHGGRYATLDELAASLAAPAAALYVLRQRDPECERLIAALLAPTR